MPVAATASEPDGDARLIRWTKGVHVDGLEGARVGEGLVEALSADPGLPTDGPLAKELADELLVTSRWLRQHAASTRVEFCSGDWQSNAHFLPSIETADLVADRG